MAVLRQLNQPKTASQGLKPLVDVIIVSGITYEL